MDRGHHTSKVISDREQQPRSKDNDGHSAAGASGRSLAEHAAGAPTVLQSSEIQSSAFYEMRGRVNAFFSFLFFLRIYMYSAGEKSSTWVEYEKWSIYSMHTEIQRCR